jgi:hypothetical protein
MPNDRNSPLHPRPALSPVGALRYAARSSNLLSGFTVEDTHAVALCERDIEYRYIPSLTREQKKVVDLLDTFGRNALIPRR